MASLEQMTRPPAGSSFTFHASTDLLYELPETPTPLTVLCSRKGCGNTVAASEQKTSGGRCGACGVPWYCSKECQKSDWKRCHKHACSTAKRVFANKPTSKEPEAPSSIEQEDKEATVAALLTKIRLYACPFAVARQHLAGKGFLLLQSPAILKDFILLESAVNPDTQAPYTRSVLLNFFTVGEFRETVAKDDFELVSVVKALEEAIEGIDELKEVCVLAKFRCGNLIILSMPLVPDITICNVLAKDYAEKESIQLNLEEE